MNVTYIMLRLVRGNYSRKLRLEDGDDLEIDLRWNRDGSYCYVACVRNRSSGQRVQSQGKKAGFLEET